MPLPAVLLLLLVAACGPSYEKTRKIDTPEAWETYLTQADPQSLDYMRGQKRLAELTFKQAQESRDIAALAAFIERYTGDGQRALREEAIKLREELLYAWADETGSPEAWKQFQDEYPKAAKKRRVEARRRIKMGQYKDTVALGPVRQERVNLAEDPEGPLNGWGWWVDVTNNGDKAWYKLTLGLYFLDDEGKVVDRKDWPVVAKYLPGYLPYETGFDKPMAPGETRTWEYTDGDIPEGWSQKVRVAPVQVIFTDDPEARSGEEDEEEKE
jgi:hypothetical protein